MLRACSLTLNEVLCRGFLTCPGETTISEVRNRVKDSHAVIVATDRDRPTGLLYTRQLTQDDLDPKACLAEVMQQNFAVIHPDALTTKVSSFLPRLSVCPYVVTGKRHEVQGVLTDELIVSRLAEDLAIARGRLEAVLDTVEEVITIIDEQDRVVGWSRKAETLYNIKSESILSKNIHDYFSNLVVTRVMRDGQGVRSVYHQPFKDTHVLISANPIKVGNNVVGAISAERDVTETVKLTQKLTHASSQVQELQSKITRITSERNPFACIRGHNNKLKELIHMANKVAGTGAPVLIRGESGTGKELFARAIHETSDRASQPFIVVNCGAIPVTLFESEVFGYEAGAFTGASKGGKIGLFESADRGTLLLDEVAELPLDMQVKLLRVLQEKVFYRVGGSTAVHIDVRFIAATNRNLEEMLNKGLFREDLYYRLNVVNLEIPPLRDRKDDLPELVYQFIQEYSLMYNKIITRLDPVVMTSLVAYSWPGNIRELKNIIERMVILTEGEVITPEYLPAVIARYQAKPKGVMMYTDLTAVTEQTERELIMETLKLTRDNRAKAAKLLGIPRSTLYYKMRQLGTYQLKCVNNTVNCTNN